MTKEDKLDVLMLLSALESYCLISVDGKKCFPDYLLVRLDDAIAKLKDGVLEEGHD